MAPEEAMFSVAEIGIGLAGFSGLVAAFAQRPGQVWQTDQKTRIVFLIVLSFGMVVCSLSPYALSGLTNAPAIVWGVPMILYSVTSLTLVVYWLVASRKYGFELQYPIFSIPIVGGATAIQIAALLSGLGVIAPYSPTIFLLGFLGVFVFGANVFLALLKSIWE